MRRLISTASLLLGLAVGCGAANEPTAFTGAKAMFRAPSADAVPVVAERASLPADFSRSRGMMGMLAEPPGASPPAVGGEAAPARKAEAPPPADGPSRKIIYNADIALVVEDFAQSEPKIAELVEAAGGYIAEQTLLGSPGARRSARWKVRVPVDRFEGFLRQITQIGELERNQRTSEDITEQFYDIEARIRNARLEEETLAGILRDRSGKLEDILKVEVELSRVRGEIEQLQGRLRLLENLSALTTVTINIREREKYQPAPPVAPDFATLVGRTFRQSVDRLVDAGKAVVLFVVAVAPWLPLIVLTAFLAWLVGRRVLRVAIRSSRRAWQIARTPITPPATP